MKRSGFQSTAIPKISVSFYYIIMLTLCWDNKIKIGRQVNKERNRYARKPPYIRTNTKVFINNYLERIWWQKFTSKFISKFTSKFISKQKRTKSMQGLRASLTASQFSVSLYSSIWSTEARLNFNFSISNRTSLKQLCHFYLYLGYRTSWRLETWSNSSSYPKHHHGTWQNGLYISNSLHGNRTVSVPEPKVRAAYYYYNYSWSFISSLRINFEQSPW